MTRYDLIEHGYTKAQAGSAMHSLCMLAKYTRSFDPRAQRHRPTYDVDINLAIEVLTNYLSTTTDQNHRIQKSFITKQALLDTLQLIKETHE